MSDIEGLDFDMPEATYHSDPCPEPSVSSSVAKIILAQTPRHAWAAHPRLNPNYVASDNKKFDLGKTAHSLILRDPRHFVLIDATDYKTNAAKQERDDAYAAGKTPLLAHQFPEVEYMVQCAREQIAQSDDNNAFVEGSSEVTLMWREQVIIDGEPFFVWCRIRIDHCAENEIDFYDYKTTAVNANPDELQNYGKQMGWHITSAFYKRGIRKVLGITDPRYKYIVQENYAPFCLSSVSMTPEAEERATRLIDKALYQWGWCLKHKRWPGYPARNVSIGLPGWYGKQLEDVEARDTALAQEGKEPLTIGVDFPLLAAPAA